MKQERINYVEVINLGFTIKESENEAYFNKYGFKKRTITYQLPNCIYLDWDQLTGFCTLIRTDSYGSIIKKMPIINLDHLEDIYDFFHDEQKIIKYAEWHQRLMGKNG